MAAAGVADGHFVCRRAAHCHQLASCRRSERRFPRLLLLPRRPRTQGRFGRRATFSAPASDLAFARSAAGGHRRLSHQTVWPQGRGGGHPPQSHPRPCRPEILVWTHLGHAVAGLAASVVGRAGPAVACNAVCPPEDNSHHPQKARLAIPHQARIGGPLGGVDRDAREKGGKNVVGGRRRRVYQGALLEAGHRHGHNRHWPTPQGCRAARPACAIAAWPTTRTGPSTHLWEEPDQPGQTCRAQARLANNRVYGLRRNDYQDLQDVSGHLRACWRSDSRGDRQGRTRLVSLLLDRSQRERGRDCGNFRRPGHDRAGLPRHQGSLGRGSTTSAEHLDERGRLSSHFVDAYAGGTLGLVPPSRGTLRSQRLPMGRSRTPPFSCGSPQSLTATHPTNRIINDYRRLVVAAKNHRVRPTSHDIGRLTLVINSESADKVFWGGYWGFFLSCS